MFFDRLKMVNFAFDFIVLRFALIYSLWIYDRFSLELAAVAAVVLRWAISSPHQNVDGKRMGKWEKERESWISFQKVIIMYANIKAPGI